MSVSVSDFGSTRHTRSIKYAAVVAALLGVLSPANAATPRIELCSLGDVSASIPAADVNSDVRVLRFGQESERDVTSHSPWLAPVGHRQPRPADIPQDKSQTTRERAQERLNAQLDQKLMICRC